MTTLKNRACKVLALSWFKTPLTSQRVRKVTSWGEEVDKPQFEPTGKTLAPIPFVPLYETRERRDYPHLSLSVSRHLQTELKGSTGHLHAHLSPLTFFKTNICRQKKTLEIPGKMFLPLLSRLFEPKKKVSMHQTFVLIQNVERSIQPPDTGHRKTVGRIHSVVTAT